MSNGIESTGKVMQRKPIDRVIFFCVPAFLLALFILNINADGEVKLAAILGSVGLCVSYYSFLRSGCVSRRYPIEDLIERDGESLIFHYFHRHERQPLKVNADTIYALNFSHRYLGVILDRNGRGFDFHYPHKEAVIKARLQEVLGEYKFNNVKKNV
ncbi:hypothetical protein [Alteromonas sp. BL110]|uniref:hypothetical protein n=1 Tax=Alteromonas sp. BL110 TaxID=1714845 RepID=UPI001E5869BB|nr:hypothetical protein [Alteromonas sp. BL110]